MSPVFHKKYKTIVKTSDHDGTLLIEMLDWIDKNSKDSIDVQFGTKIVYFAFENEDDALIFKIKYPTI